MRGEVEVYRVINNRSELIAKEENLLVDGAAQTIVDMLTTSPSLSGVESASALLDTSNYTIQAISFGKPWQLFSSSQEYMSAHYSGSGAVNQNFLANNWVKSCCSATAEVGQTAGVDRFITLTHDKNGFDSGVSSITWQHLKDTPEGISPTDTRLQQNSTKTFLETKVPLLLTQYVGLFTNVLDSSVSSYFLSGDSAISLEPGFDNGQNLNLLALSGAQDTYFQSIIDLAETTSSIAELVGPLELTISALEYPQNLVGCYPPSAGIDLVLTSRAAGIAEQRFYTSRSGEVPFTASSNFNWAGKESMDASGWVKLVNPEGVGTVEEPDDGLVVSAQSDGSFSSTGEIVYKVTVSGGDAACASMFGGIWYMGLWTFDNESILCNGTTPPYSWNNINNPRRYRLFSKKAFTKDITYHIDNGTTAGLKDLADNGKLDIIWRIYV